MESRNSSTPLTEKRNYPRVECQVPAKFRTMDPEDMPNNGTRPAKVPMTVTDLSLGGACIQSLEPLKEGKLCHLEIDFPKPYSQLTVFAEVRWTAEKEVGLQFLAIQEERIKELKDFIQSPEK
jgi:hypothetical protein